MGTVGSLIAPLQASAEKIEVSGIALCVLECELTQCNALLGVDVILGLQSSQGTVQQRSRDVLYEQATNKCKTCVILESFTAVTTGRRPPELHVRVGGMATESAVNYQHFPVFTMPVMRDNTCCHPYTITGPRQGEQPASVPATSTVDTEFDTAKLY
jgi:hypothetical protein